MAVFYTSYFHQTGSASHESSIGNHHHDTTGVATSPIPIASVPVTIPATLYETDSVLAIANITGHQDTKGIDTDGPLMNPNYYQTFGGAPADGGVIWYCGECKEGPYNDWLNICQNVDCQHKRCDEKHCNVEKV